MPTNVNPVMTIGHSNHPMERFLQLLHQHQVQTVIDVRTTPASRCHPHFNRNIFNRTLAANGVAYIFAGALLGGRPDLLALYTPEGRADYRGMAMTSAFIEGIDLVEAECLKSVIVLMCSEKDPTSCHRALLIGHHPHNHGHDVRHILPDHMDPEPHPTLPKRLMRRHRVDDPEQAVDAQSARAAYRFRT